MCPRSEVGNEGLAFLSAFEDPDILMGLAVRNLNSHGGSSQLALAAFVGDPNGLQELEP